MCVVLLKIHLCFLDLEHDLEADAVEDGDALEIDLKEDEVAFEDDKACGRNLFVFIYIINLEQN